MKICTDSLGFDDLFV